MFWAQNSNAQICIWKCDGPSPHTSLCIFKKLARKVCCRKWVIHNRQSSKILLSFYYSRVCVSMWVESKLKAFRHHHDLILVSVVSHILNIYGHVPHFRWLISGWFGLLAFVASWKHGPSTLTRVPSVPEKLLVSIKSDIKSNDDV